MRHVLQKAIYMQKSDTDMVLFAERHGSLS